MIQFITDISNFLHTFDWGGFFSDARIVFIILDILLFLGFIYSFKEAWKFRPPIEGEFVEGEGNGSVESEAKKRTFSFDVESFRKNWVDIENKVREGTPHSLVLGVISADNLVDAALKQMGLEGEHMADRLQKIKESDFEEIEDLWRAHKIRNELVHTPGFEIKRNEAEEMLRVYESFLRTIRALK